MVRVTAATRVLSLASAHLSGESEELLLYRPANSSIILYSG